MMISCREAARLASEALDRPLLFSERVALAFHLRICEACRFYQEQISFLHDSVILLLGRFDEDDPLPDASLSAQARDRIRRALSS